jgi:homoserine dehydrogenase
MSESSVIQIALAGAGLLGTAVIALLNVKQNQADKAAEKRLEELHVAILAVRSDLRVMDGDVRKHSEKIGALSAIAEALTSRLRNLEDESREMLRDGCAHRKKCNVED